MNGFRLNDVNRYKVMTKSGAPYNDNETCEIIIEFKGHNDCQEELIKKYGTIKNYFPMINSYVVELPKKHIEELQMQENVSAVFENTRITAQMNNSRRAVRADSAHKRGFDGSGVTLALLDTGIAAVQDFTYPKNRILVFKDFVNGKNTPYDDNGHGTHVPYLSSHRLILLEMRLI